MTDKEKFYKICHNILDNRTAVISGHSDNDLLVYYKPYPFGDLLYLYYDFEDNTFSICMVKDNYDQSYPTIGIWYPDRMVNQGTTIDSVIKFLKINDFKCLLKGVEE